MDAAAAKAAAAMEATTMKSATVKTAPMKSAPMKSAAVKAAPAVKASTSTVSAAAAVAATTSSLGSVRERQSQNGCQQGTRKNSRERQRNAFAVPSSQHVCLHRYRRQSGGPWATDKNALAGR
jgi:hypothetical protein